MPSGSFLYIKLSISCIFYKSVTYIPTDGRTDGRTDGPTDGPTDGQTLIWRSEDASKRGTPPHTYKALDGLGIMN